MGDEIEENEKQNQLKEEEEEEEEKKNENGVDWSRILEEVQAKNVHFIKHIISSKEIEINAQNPENGKTLVIYAVIMGNLNFVKTTCDFGADVSIKDKEGKDALDYAMQYGRYKITELI